MYPKDLHRLSITFSQGILPKICLPVDRSSQSILVPQHQDWPLLGKGSPRVSLARLVAVLRPMPQGVGAHVSPLGGSLRQGGSAGQSHAAPDATHHLVYGAWGDKIISINIIPLEHRAKMQSD